MGSAIENLIEALSIYEDMSISFYPDSELYKLVRNKFNVSAGKTEYDVEFCGTFDELENYCKKY